MTASPKESKPALPSSLQIVGASLALAKSRASEFYGYAAWLLLPLLVFVVANASGTRGEQILSAVGNAGFLLLAAWVTAACIVTTAFYTVHQKHEADPRHVSSHSWKLVVPLLVVQLITSVIQVAGLVLLVFPGIIVMVLFAFGAQEVVLNNRRSFTALAGSRDLVRGRFMEVMSRWFGVLFIFLLALFAVTALILFVAGAIMGTEALAAVAEQPPLWLDMLLSVAQIALSPPLIIAQTLLYLALEKE
jgi:hypothetical protein